EGVLLNKAQTTLIQVPSGRTGAYEIPNSATGIGDSAFAGCRLLTQVTMGGNVASIGGGAFSNCTGLSEIALGAGVTSVGSYAFSNCTGLEQVTIGPLVTTIGSSAFSGCDNLQAFNVSTTNPSFSSLGGLLYNKTQTNFIQCPGGFTGAVTVSSGVTTIDTNAFSLSRNLTAIHVDPANSAFSSINGILFNKTQTNIIRCPMGKSGTVQISAGVTSISYSAFFGCRQVAAFEVDLNNPAYRSLDGVLYNKAGTTLLNCPLGKSGAVTLSAIVTGITDGALGGCIFLTAIHVDPANPVYASVDGVLFNKSLSHLIQYPGGKTGYAIIPASVISLAYAFDGRDNLAGLVFLGNAPSSTYYSFDTSVPVQHFEGAIGFSSSTWSSWTVIDMGVQSPIKLWLLTNAFPYDTNMSSDMNGDGVSLLMAYALNLNPRGNLASSMPQPGLSGGYLTITYYAAKAGITYRVETSGDLKTWTTQGVSISPQNANGYRTASVPATDAGRYIRLAVSE
ncbi:MAG TPA: leucine-rich repeat domain-containing protein, partial [Candidatus Paceibacterota bacterium]|nr:leucine-rich repeat domain-containing protein [Candidatus Paceibacterota bacterium]